MAKFKFTIEQLNEMVLAELEDEGQKPVDKPNALKMLLAKAGIGRSKDEGEAVER